ncbi:unnamed protein product [Vicia faba]|uniref:Leucine-rich repeat-containing N-terminal plant-type domain-containing protein n=1 Tax=Vicia faba TaxID=3906 RepID=A0AAV1AG92_VICFA|nr:unnamed protein product [Vicia faba]
MTKPPSPNHLRQFLHLPTFINSPPQLGWPANGVDPYGQSWKGITCSDTRVTQINLSNLALTGTLPYGLDRLTSLTNLDMSNNNLVGTIPYQLPPNLQRLNFAHNNLTGTLPYSISNLTSLTHLNLNHNQLQQPLNLNFLNLSTLSKLDLSFNSLTGDLPPTMSSLSGITTMYLQNNQFTGTIDILANLTLNSLNVENNNFTGWILERLKNIDDLQTGGNAWSSGPAPPPPPGTPPIPKSKPNPLSTHSNPLFNNFRSPLHLQPCEPPSHHRQPTTSSSLFSFTFSVQQQHFLSPTSLP